MSWLPWAWRLELSSEVWILVLVPGYSAWCAGNGPACMGACDGGGGQDACVCFRLSPWNLLSAPRPSSFSFSFLSRNLAVWGLEHAFFPTPTLSRWEVELGLGSSCLPHRLKFSEGGTISHLPAGGAQRVKHTADTNALLPDCKGGKGDLESRFFQNIPLSAVQRCAWHLRSPSVLPFHPMEDKCHSYWNRSSHLGGSTGIFSQLIPILGAKARAMGQNPDWTPWGTMHKSASRVLVWGVFPQFLTPKRESSPRKYHGL